VLVLERRNVVGGACVTEEVFPGYRVSTAAYLVSLLQERVVKDLELRRFGYERGSRGSAAESRSSGSRTSCTRPHARSWMTICLR